MPSAYIPDGYTEEAEIPAQPGHFDDSFTIEWRPLTWEERRRHFKDVTSENVDDKTSELVLKRLVSWNIESDGKPVTISEQNLSRLEHFAHEAIAAKVLDIKLGKQEADQKN